METQFLELGFMWVDTPGEQGKASAWAWSGRRPQFRGPAIGWVLLGGLLQHLGQAGGSPRHPKGSEKAGEKQLLGSSTHEGQAFLSPISLTCKRQELEGCCST